MNEPFRITPEQVAGWDMNQKAAEELDDKRIDRNYRRTVYDLRWQDYDNPSLTPFLTLSNAMRIEEDSWLQYRTQIKQEFLKGKPGILAFFDREVELVSLVKDNFVGQTARRDSRPQPKFYLVGRLGESEAPPWITVRIGCFLDPGRENDPCLEILALRPDEVPILATRWVSTYRPDSRAVDKGKENCRGPQKSVTTEGLLVPQAIEIAIKNSEITFAEAYQDLVRDI